ncbi:winged helix-turn-helix domain-containing protein [Cohaesibacter intestini]|uniref:winged helix-turn-helix domain-containing protein n=1 Tax=Cohaesibacter intestini TaxID=2211145 RepID=UPI000DE87306|nr:crosslink repair DNA glycosylase YcaQ family protein [Cohaesibacter intestini]
MTMQSLSNRQARRIALKAQGFLPQMRGLKRPDQRHLAAIFDSIGLLQIDSVNVLDRAHYLTLFARLGAYDRKLIDRAAHEVTSLSKPKAYFEYWGHEASILPVALYPALRWRMEDAARHQGLWGGIGRFAKENPERVEAVYRTIEEQGPIGVGALDKERKGKGAWWGWSDTKIALEFLFWSGRITSAGRQTFARLYDIPERVLPADILAQGTLPAGEAKRQLIEIGARSHGVGTEACFRDYFRLSPKDSKQAVAELVEMGVLDPVEVEGFAKQAYLHKDAVIPARAQCQALLAPFDSLIFMRDRAETLFNFRYRIEIYVPKEKRQFGYYVLPFLMGDQLVARLDLKANRQEGILEVFASHGEPKIDQGKVAKALIAELEMMAQWMGLSDIRIHEQGDLAVSLKQASAE